ncbi:MAG: 4Fe-4S dicluster domain-containing protein [Pseudomonadota bacterium]
MNVVYIEIDRCIACLSCERVCFFYQADAHNGHAANIFVHVDMDLRRIFTVTCRQCEVAMCMKVCPSGALSRDAATHAVVVDKSRCMGCGMCVAACPFGSVQIDGMQRVATKCDLCGGHPRCVDVCMAKALHFGSIKELAELKRKRTDSRFGLRAVPLGGDPDES